MGRGGRDENTQWAALRFRTIWGHIVVVRNYKWTHSVALRGRGDVLK